MTVVVFTPSGAKIYEGANEKDFKGQSYLVNPTYPRGIPPHLWKLKDGQIEGAPEMPKELKIPGYLYGIIGFILGVAACLITLK